MGFAGNLPRYARLVLLLTAAARCAAVPSDVPVGGDRGSKGELTEKGADPTPATGPTRYQADLQARVDEDWQAYGFPAQDGSYVDANGSSAWEIEACVMEYTVTAGTVGGVVGGAGAALGCGTATVVALVYTGPGAIVVGGSCAPSIPVAALEVGVLTGAVGNLYGRLRCSDALRNWIADKGEWLVSEGFRLFGATDADEARLRKALAQPSAERSDNHGGDLETVVHEYNVPETVSLPFRLSSGAHSLHSTNRSNCGGADQLCCASKLWDEIQRERPNISSVRLRCPDSRAEPLEEFLGGADAKLEAFVRALAGTATPPVPPTAVWKLLLTQLRDENGKRSEFVCRCLG